MALLLLLAAAALMAWLSSGLAGHGLDLVGRCVIFVRTYARPAL